MTCTSRQAETTPTAVAGRRVRQPPHKRARKTRAAKKSLTRCESWSRHKGCQGGSEHARPQARPMTPSCLASAEADAAPRSTPTPHPTKGGAPVLTIISIIGALLSISAAIYATNINKRP